MKNLKLAELKEKSAKLKKGKLRLASKLSSGAVAGKSGRFVLFLGDDGAILVFIQGGKVVRRLFAPSVEAEHLASLVELMESHPNYPVYVLVDMIDQSYVRHTLPPVSVLGVNKLIQRRLDRDFVPEDIKGSLSLGREKTGRREWNFLLIALANSSALQQWMNALLDLPNRLAGLYLVPVEAQAFVSDLADVTPGRDAGDAPSWQILVMHDKVSGFRQVVLRDGRLIFTRLTQLGHETSPEVNAGNVEQEVQNTVEYLRRLSYSEQAGLEIFIIVSQDIREKIDPGRLKATKAHLFTPFEVAQLMQLGQAALSADRFADVVFATSFGMRGKHILKLMPAYGKQLDLLYKGRLGMRVAAAAVLLAIGLDIGSQLLSINDMRSETAKLREEEKKTSKELEDINSAIKGLGENQNLILNAAAVYHSSLSSEYKPLEFVQNFAPILGPGTLVRSIYWQASDTSKGRTPAAATPPTGAAAQDKKYYPFTVNLEVEINNHGGERQKLVELSDAFVGRIHSAFPDFQVDNEKLKGTPARDEKLVLNFNDPTKSNVELKEGDNILKFTMTGPLPPELLKPTGAGKP